MLDGLTGFFKRHRRKIFITTGLAASIYFVTDYLKYKLVELQERIATEREAKENLKRRFEQNQKDATFTIMALLPSLSTPIMEAYQVEKITQELQAIRLEKKQSKTSNDNASEVSVSVGSVQQQTPNSGIDSNAGSVASLLPGESSQTKLSKTQLWKELKVQSLTRAIALIYSSALLVFFTRLQLNILGRKNYVLSVIQLAENTNVSNDENLNVLDQEDLSRLAIEEQEMVINRMYLTFSWWLLNKGWVTLAQKVEDAVSSVFGEVNPRADLTLQEFSNMLGKVQFEVDHPSTAEIPSNFLSNLLPPAELESYVLAQAPLTKNDNPPLEGIIPPLRRLLDETADFIESPDAINVIQRMVHAGLSIFVNKISASYPAPPLESISSANVLAQAQSTNPSAVAVTAPGATLKLASISASASKQAHSLASGSPLNPNEYINAMINVPELDGFSAVVYSNFDWTSIQNR